MRRLLLGLFVALLGSVALTLLASLVICLGLNPMLFEGFDGAAPLLGILAGAYVAARGGSWKAGAVVGAVFVVLWIGFWMYVMGRWNPLVWIEEGLPRLTPAHLGWWSAALIAGVAGGLARRMRPVIFTMIFAALTAAALVFADISLRSNPELPAGGPGTLAGASGAASPNAAWKKVDGAEQLGPLADGTMGWLHTFSFQGRNKLNAGVYDCDSDDASPYDDANTTYMGQDLAALVGKLNFRDAAARRKVVCVVNGGFFGASGWSVARHEEPLVENGRELYNVDLLRPKDQSWFLAVGAPNAVLAGRPRFSMLSSLPWDRLSNYQAVLGGVRPLRVEGHSVDLKPGAGVTTLKCSRTSIGWTADGGTLFVLTIFDPDGELTSQLQRKSGGAQTGGWDVAQVQKFWEDRQVPYALLFDGGESTQLAVRNAQDRYSYVPSGYQYSFTLAYLFQRPLRFTLPILPPSEAHRGVMNYFYVDGLAGVGE